MSVNSCVPFSTFSCGLVLCLFSSHCLLSALRSSNLQIKKRVGKLCFSYYLMNQLWINSPPHLDHLNCFCSLVLTFFCMECSISLDILTCPRFPHAFPTFILSCFGWHILSNSSTAFSLGIIQLIDFNWINTIICRFAFQIPRKINFYF